MPQNTSRRRPVVAVLTAANEAFPPGLEPLHEQADVIHCDDEGSVATALKRADALLVTDFRTDLLRRQWTGSTNIRWIHAASAGVDTLMFPELIQSDIRITNARGVFDDAIAEFVLALVLIFAKDFMTTFELQRDRRWQHRDTERIAGREVLMVGVGAIGRAIARLLRAAGMSVTGIGRSRRVGDQDFRSTETGDALPRLLPKSDFVVLALPLTDETRGMFGAEQFRAMRANARLINIARGEIVRTDDLVAALENGAIAGAALDVFEEEPLPPRHRLYELPNVILSSHMAGDTLGWREALSRQFLDNFARWRRGEELLNVVST